MKWENVKWNGDKVCITLKNGKKYVGKISICRHYVDFGPIDTHIQACKDIFGNCNGLNLKHIKILSNLLQMEIFKGYCPETNDPKEFINEFYEKIGKHGIDIFEEL